MAESQDEDEEEEDDEIDLTSPLEEDCAWKRGKSSGSVHSGKQQSVGPWEPGMLKWNVSCEETSLPARSVSGSGRPTSPRSQKQRRRHFFHSERSGPGPYAHGREDDVSTLRTVSDNTSIGDSSVFSLGPATRQLSPPAMPKLGASVRATVASLSAASPCKEFSFPLPGSLCLPERSRLKGSSETTEVGCQTGVECTDQSTETSVAWSGQGFACRACFKPPLIPTGATLLPPSGREPRRRGSRRSSSTSAVSSARINQPANGVLGDQAGSGRPNGHFIRTETLESFDLGTGQSPLSFHAPAYDVKNIDDLLPQATGPLDGLWVLLEDSANFHVNSWLRSLQIQGIDVIDGDGECFRLTTDSQGTRLSGGLLGLSEDGNFLLRTGKSGNPLIFERVFSNKIVHSDPIVMGTTCASQEPELEHPDSCQTSVSQMDESDG